MNAHTAISSALSLSAIRLWVQAGTGGDGNDSASCAAVADAIENSYVRDGSGGEL